METTRQRLPAAERRESILAAATVVFGERGYAGATTDQIATAAGISQAYVVRTFGSKETLFVEVARRAVGRIEAAFRSAIEADDGRPVDQRLGQAYLELIADRGILLALLHIFSLGNDPAIGPVGREGFLTIYRLVRDEAGLAPEDASHFLAEGMLINTVLALQLHDCDDPDALELVTQACGGDLVRFRALAAG
ncbi:TetR/AcrR family transcriptional regulator [Jiangella rhizosphaerae]|uniref:TetR/AcrR family transcriptional regulator n=1 Tax=Jiangella rhizosphaerae TaxID=2293569 RepID=A0A418KU97_9ACTN|nr:TetR/AcrR family transcriptional regulator [Jiangella rhizosphaerae]RIQ30095.1 TetR/AcrR family transcriptional regulator [Jiangella rhizosphaerae]